MSERSEDRFRLLIVGAGVAGLECALAVRELAGDRVATTLVAPDDTFVYRPMRVREPFAHRAAERYSLAGIAGDIGVGLVGDRFGWLDASASAMHTQAGAALEFDGLLLAMGARRRPAFTHGLTIDDRQLDEQLHGLIQDVEQGYVRSIAFIAPPGMAWPLPLYELALMTASRAYDMQTEVAITIVSPEAAPLAIFGAPVCDAVAELLENHGMTFIGAAHCTVPEPGRVIVHRDGRNVAADRIVALPQLFGPSAAGVPGGVPGGFIPVDVHCRVRGLDRIFAAGDATDFPIKHGTIAAQQADAAAAAVAALAGAPVPAEPFHPEIRAILLGGARPLYLSARVSGGRGTSSQMSTEPLWSPPTKIAARYLAPYLASTDLNGAATAQAARRSFTQRD